MPSGLTKFSKADLTFSVKGSLQKYSRIPVCKDEYLEITPQSVRLRKQILTKNMRDKNA